MVSTDQELQALERDRQRSAAKVRSLLVQLEEAEKEFAAITERVKAFRDPVSGSRAPRSAAPVHRPNLSGAATPRA